MDERVDIEAMIRRAKSDREAQNALLTLYQAYLRVLARVQIGHKLELKADASDLVQDTLLQAHVAFHQFRGATERELLAWLRKILQSRLMNLLRLHSAGRRDHRLEQSLHADLDASAAGLERILPADVDTPSKQVARREAAVGLANALEQLSDDYREVITLHHVEGLKFADVAIKMNRSAAATQRMWVRALVRLREILQEQ